MKKLKKLYSSSPIIQFLCSYILVLIIPMLILFYGFYNAFAIVENDIKESNIAMLSKSMYLINEEVRTLESLSLQTSNYAPLRELGTMTSRKGRYITSVKDVISEFYVLINYQSLPLLESAYIYLSQMDLIIYDHSVYHPDVFAQYIDGWGMTMDEWYAMCHNGITSRSHYYISSDGSIQYVMPFSDSLFGNNLGVIVYRYNKEEIHRLLSFGYDEYSIFVLDNDNQILYNEDLLGIGDTIPFEELTSTGVSSVEPNYWIYTAVQTPSWKYILALPEATQTQLTVLKNLVLILVLVASAIGVLISILLSISKGKPINTLIHSVMTEEELAENSPNLGNLATLIQAKNETLLQEIEEDKPMLQKAFFHNLIKAEFLTSKEMYYNAEKAGIKINGNQFVAVSVKLFPDNDFYTVDLQTIEEVQLLTQLLLKQITEVYSSSVWSYKKNYLTCLFIFQLEKQPNQILTLVEQTYHWLFSEYEVESFWGISAPCTNLLDIWKNCEEAYTAMEHCNGEKHIQQYHPNLANQAELYFPETAREKLSAALKSGDSTSCETILDILENENFTNRTLNRNQFIRLNRYITDIFTSLTLPDITERILWLNEEAIGYHESHKEYFYRLRSICSDICKQIQQNKSLQHGKLIERIQQYIQENYMNSGLGLSRISSEFHISEGYVSSIFKEQSNVNFGDYVENIRINKACQLLKENEHTISEISEFVGYNSVQSFRRAFKRVMGISPKEYR